MDQRGNANNELNLVNENLDRLEDLLNPSNFKLWLLKAEMNYEDNILFVIIEDVEHFSLELGRPEKPTRVALLVVKNLNFVLYFHLSHLAFSYP